jgi:hypothetical protein
MSKIFSVLPVDGMKSGTLLRGVPEDDTRTLNCKQDTITRCAPEKWSVLTIQQ